MSATKAALSRFETAFGKSFGEGTMRRATEVIPYDVVSTGSLTLDYATGVGGFVEGRLYEFWGADAIGKTTMALIAGAEYQRKYPDRFVCLIDIEGTFDKAWGETLGLDTERVYHISPKTAEDVADMMSFVLREARLKHGVEFGIVILDSIGAMLTKKESEKQADEMTVGGAAKVVTRMVKKASIDARDTGAVVVFINQVRDKIGTMSRQTEDTPGGRALKHSTTMKFHFRVGGESLKEKRGSDMVIVGRPLAVRIDRNKVAPPFRTAEVVLTHEPSKYGPVGVNKNSEAFDLGVRFGVIEQSGGWYRWHGWGKDEKAVQGADRMTEWLTANPSAVEEVRLAALASVAHEVIPEEQVTMEDFEDDVAVS